MQHTYRSLAQRYSRPIYGLSTLVLLTALTACSSSQTSGSDSAPSSQAPPAQVQIEAGAPPIPNPDAQQTGEEYNPIQENPFLRANAYPLSTFGIDVDTAAYSNVRRFINQGQRPPKDAIRIEELINYFSYAYPQPKGEQPFSVTTEVAAAPWNPQHRLVQIGLQGQRLSTENLPPSNLVFLLDVSGSMNAPNKLPLLKSSLQLMVNELNANDRVAIVVYAGSAGLVLPSTPGSQKAKILGAIDQLEAGGSTAGGEGIELAYKVAQEQFIRSGNNRVILATDGDFNVGPSSDAELVELIEQKREKGVFLTVLGFGQGNLKDAKMEQIANKGNGQFAYIDSLLEAKKALVTELGGTLVAIAKDVKIQVAFNPKQVQRYRLIGYENRLLQSQDFEDDRKDAGELGAGHTVTALYEIIPSGVQDDSPAIEPPSGEQPLPTFQSNELLQVNLRYKLPQQNESQLITQSVTDQGLTFDKASTNLRFSAAVAAFGMVLRESAHKGNATLAQVQAWATQAQGPDLEGYRAEFLRLVEKSKTLS
ncbi:VWA domain-containing protein [Acaryochloris sp. IP29b_bin.137]|uniref:vWA domain-containing protein n=1 Tax=Acaryochloris sp. IP29b_bin.137 TaxID=2969217 RepID=UPI00260D21BE|nr:VWA domain-containing protein [Acaryochloris sp. IP29b_bin.137]